MFARTERLLLRPGWAEDAPAVFAAINDPGMARNLARVPWPYGLADAQAFLAMERGPREPALLIFRRTGRSPELVGAVGIGPAPCGAFELGYWIARPHWGHGYASEAGAALIRIARESLRLRRLIAGHFLDNPASGRVLRKLGFCPTGAIGSRHSIARGEDVPCAEFELDLDPAQAVAPGGGCDMMAA